MFLVVKTFLKKLLLSITLWSMAFTPLAFSQGRETEYFIGELIKRNQIDLNHPSMQDTDLESIQAITEGATGADVMAVQEEANERLLEEVAEEDRNGSARKNDAEKALSEEMKTFANEDIGNVLGDEQNGLIKELNSFIENKSGNKFKPNNLKNDVTKPIFNKYFSSYEEKMDKAEDIKNRLRSYINGLSNNGRSLEVIELYFEYTQYVVLGLRRLALVFQDEAAERGKNLLRENSELLFDINKTAIASGNYERLELLLEGENFRTKNGVHFPFKVNNSGSKYTISFADHHRRVMSDIALMMSVPNTLTYMKATKWFTAYMMAEQTYFTKKFAAKDGRSGSQLPGASTVNMRSCGKSRDTYGLQGAFPDRLSFDNHPKVRQGWNPAFDRYKMLNATGLIMSAPDSMGADYLGFNPDQEKFAEYHTMKSKADAYIAHLAHMPSSKFEENLFGTWPMEQITRAYWGHSKNAPRGFTRPKLFDFEHFDAIYAYKFPSLMEKMNDFADPTYADRKRAQDEMWCHIPDGKDHLLTAEEMCPTLETDYQCNRNLPSEKQLLDMSYAFSLYVPEADGDQIKLGHDYYPGNEIGEGQWRAVNGRSNNRVDIENEVIRIQDKTGRNRVFNFDSIRHYTAYMVRMMDVNRQTDITKLIKEEIGPSRVSEMENNNFTIEFPSYYDPDDIKKLALGAITDKLHEALAHVAEGNRSDLFNKVKSNLKSNLITGYQNINFDLTAIPSNSRNDAKKILKAIEFLSPNMGNIESEYFPAYLTQSKALKDRWKDLENLYNQLKRAGFLSDTDVYDSEWSYTINSFRQGNPAAAIKLSYEMLMTKMKKASGGYNCQEKKLNTLGGLLRMNKHTTFAPFHSNNIITKAKQRKLIWSDIYEKISKESNGYLAINPNIGTNSNNSYGPFGLTSSDPDNLTFFDKLREIATTPLIIKENFLGQSLPNGAQASPEIAKLQRKSGGLRHWLGGSYTDVQNNVNKYFSHPETQPTRELYLIWKNSDPATKERKAREFFERYAARMSNNEYVDYNKRYPENPESIRPWNANSYDMKFDPKEHLIEADFRSKYHLFNGVLRDAATAKYGQLSSNSQHGANLQSLCDKEYDDVLDYQDIFYSTVTMQEALNDKFGAEGVPNSVMRQVRYMAKSEKIAMWMAMGLLPSILIPMVLMSACFLGAPVCVAIIVAGGVATAGLIAGNVAYNDRQYKESNNYARTVSSYHELNYTDKTSVRKMKRGPWMLLFDAVMALSLFEIGKLSYLTIKFALKELMRRGTSKATGSIITHAYRRANIVMSYQKLQFLSGKRLRLKNGRWVIETNPRSSLSLKEFYRQELKNGRGAIAASTQYSNGIVKVTNDMDENGAKRILNSFVAGALRGRYASRGGAAGLKKTLLGRADPGKKALYEQKLRKFTASREKWMKHTGKMKFVKGILSFYNKQKARKMQMKLIILEVIERLDDAIRAGQGIEDFVIANMDILPKLRSLPIKLSDFIFYAGVQGMPMSVTKIPLIQRAWDGAMIKMIMQSYDNIAGEYLRQHVVTRVLGSKAAQNLFDGAEPIKHDSWSFIKIFLEDINWFKAREMKLNSQGGRKLVEEHEDYVNLKDAITDAVMQKLRNKNIDLTAAGGTGKYKVDSKEELKMLLFNATEDNPFYWRIPDDPSLPPISALDDDLLMHHRTVAQSLWNQFELSELLQITDPNSNAILGRFNYEMAKELADMQAKSNQPQTLDDFSQYMRTIRIWFESSRANTSM